MLEIEIAYRVSSMSVVINCMYFILLFLAKAWNNAFAIFMGNRFSD